MSICLKNGFKIIAILLIISIGLEKRVKLGGLTPEKRVKYRCISLEKRVKNG